MTIFSVPENLAFENYEALKAGLDAWLDRSDLAGASGTMIALCEARLRRELEALFDELSVTVDVTAGLGELPPEFGTATRVSYDGRWLPQWSRAMATEAAAGPRPTAYTIERNSIRLWPECTVQVAVLYYPRFPQLSETNPSNSILARHPDVYFFGSLMFAEGYLANDARAAMFKALWDEAIAEVKAYLLRQKYAGPLVPKLP